jgi:spore cortex biosynthesis protein YabQ
MFLTAAVTGMALGFFYDIIRITRRIVRRRDIFIQIEDLVFWIAAAAAAFAVMMDKFNGEVRPYVLIGTGLGMAFYFALPSVFIMAAAQRITEFMGRVLKKIVCPVKRRWRICVYPVKKLINYLGRKTKKVLHLCKVCAKLKMRHFVKDVKSVTKK